MEVNSLIVTDFTKNWLKSLLQTNAPMEIMFTKVNGDSRSMLCTLNPEYIPEDQLPKPKVIVEGEKPKDMAISDETLKVFDTEVQGWRSFRWDSLNYINV